MFNLWQENNKWKAEHQYGDICQVAFTITEDDVAVDLTGQTLKLGICDAQHNNLLDTTGTVVANEVTFELQPSDYKGILESKKTYLFDFWNETNEFTYIELGQWKVLPVAHEVD